MGDYLYGIEEKVISLMFMVVSIIHLVPIIGVLGSERLSFLYGLDFEEPNLLILMRHRGVLFGLLGVFLAYAAWQPQFQLIGLIAATASLGSFILIAWFTHDYNAAIDKLIKGDLVGMLCVLIIAGLMILR